MRRMAPSQSPRCTGSRFHGCALAALLAAAMCSKAQDRDCRALADALTDTPSDSLAGKLEIGAPELPAGLTCRRRFESTADSATVLIRSELTNTTTAPLKLDQVPLLEVEIRLRPERDGPYERLAQYQDQDKWYESNYWTAGGWTRIGRNWHHPGPDQPTVRTFRCPETGQISVTGRVFKMHAQAGTSGVNVCIRHQLDMVWSATLAGDDAKGQEPNLTLSVRKGDAVRFIVDSNGTINCDTTGWDPVIQYSGGETFQASTGFGPRQGHGGWTYEVQTAEPVEERFKPLVYSQGRWYDSTFWQGGHTWCRVGKNWHHPGEGMPSVRRFTCPKPGRLTVSGRVFALHQGGDGTTAWIRHNAKDIWRQTIAGDDDTGVQHRLQLDVQEGDAIRFLVAQHQAISCDTTGWDPLIEYDDGAAFQASDGFAATQGANHWYYERCGADTPPPPAPVAAWLDRALLLHRAATQYGDTSRALASANDMLPFCIVSDGANRTGFSLGVDTAQPCEVRTKLAPDGQLFTIQFALCQPTTVAPGTALTLPLLALMPYAGTWTAGLGALPNWTGRHGGQPILARLAERQQGAFAALREMAPDLPDLDLLVLIQAEWLREDKIDGSVPAWERATHDHLDRTRALISLLRRQHQALDVQTLKAQLEALATRASTLPGDAAPWRELYQRVRLLKRRVVLSNPVYDFGQLLFCKRRLCRWSHLNMQYFGFRARAGGGVYVLERPGYSTSVRNIIGGQLPPGSVLEPRLSYDGKRVVFSYVHCGGTELDAKSLVQNEKGEDTGYYHVYEIGVDGNGLRQLTRGTYDDVMPNYLPDGGVVFCSTRRRSYSRCFGINYSWRWHAYTLHRTEADGRNLRALSCNDVAEWFPSVSNTGHIIFARWDYIDRDAVTHQNLWATRPDGTNPSAVWGNASPKPHCMFQAKAIPNSSKIVFIASAHHALTGGPVCILDPSVDSNNALEAITRVTPQPFPEAEGFSLRDYYEFAWPLSEQHFLVGYSNTDLRSQGRSYKDPTPDNALGIYVLDTAGNRELLYRDPMLNSSTPIPLRARPRPPVLESALSPDSPDTGEFLITDVYEGLGQVQRGTIKEIRVVQVFPKVTALANNPLIGFAGEENARAVLGTAPVEPDGSARFTAAARKPILFQALDANGFAYQTMRSTTAVQPGESSSCIGCHENRMKAPRPPTPMASKRPASKLKQGPFDGVPFSYMRVVQPIWDTHCIGCHGEKSPKGGVSLTATVRGGFAASYRALCGEPTDFHGTKTSPDNAAKALVPRFGQRNRVQVTPPGGIYGALGSRLVTMLRAGHQKVRLTDAEMRRIAMWIDLNAVFYGAYTAERQAAQLAGKNISMPEIQ